MFPCSHGNISFARAPLIFLCSHVPMEIFLFYETGKKQGNKRDFMRLDFNDKYLFSVYLSNWVQNSFYQPTPWMKFLLILCSTISVCVCGVLWWWGGRGSEWIWHKSQFSIVPLPPCCP
jgi:hypothetical protein